MRRSQRIRCQPDRYGERSAEMAHYSLSAQELVKDDPTSLDDAKRRDDWPKWKEAMEKEYFSLIENGTWISRCA